MELRQGAAGLARGAARAAALSAAAATLAATAAAAPALASAGGTVEMHRLYNPYTGEHFYTASEYERDSLSSVGWSYEGVGWVAPESSATPVFRLYNPYAGDHHYTTSAGERDALVAAGWSDEGVGWHSDDEEGIPLYRQYNPYATVGTHNYTTSKDENDMLVSVGWNAEGIGWYGVADPTPAEPNPASDFEYTVGDYIRDRNGVGTGDPKSLEYTTDDGYKHEEQKVKMTNDRGDFTIEWSSYTHSEVNAGGGRAPEYGHACGHGVYITGVRDGLTDVTVPDTIDGLPVVYFNIPGAAFKYKGGELTPPIEYGRIDLSQCRHLKYLVLGSRNADYNMPCCHITSLRLGSNESLHSLLINDARLDCRVDMGGLAGLRLFESYNSFISGLSGDLTSLEHFTQWGTTFDHLEFKDMPYLQDVTASVGRLTLDNCPVLVSVNVDHLDEGGYTKSGCPQLSDEVTIYGKGRW